MALGRTRRLRWAAPFVVAAVIGLIALIPTLSAGADPPADQLTAQQLLVKIHDANVQSFSGSIALTTNLGIPNLSSLGNIAGRNSGFNPTDLLSGTHQAQVWADGPDKQRIALPSSLAETDVIHNGSDVWVWQSTGSKVEHLTGVTGPDTGAQAEPAGTPTVETPAQLADKLLNEVGASTSVSSATPSTAANRPAYVLEIEPRSADSTIDHIDIYVDHDTGVPLQVSLYAKSAPTPILALQLGFTQVSFKAPASSEFDFTPPPGATVTTKAIGSGPASGSTTTEPATGSGANGTKVVGQDWTQVVIASSTGPLPRGSGDVLNAATPVTGQFGRGRLLQTNLVNVLFLDDGRVAVGAVTPAALEAAVPPAG